MILCTDRFQIVISTILKAKLQYSVTSFTVYWWIPEVTLIINIWSLQTFFMFLTHNNIKPWPIYHFYHISFIKSPRIFIFSVLFLFTMLICFGFFTMDWDFLSFDIFITYIHSSLMVTEMKRGFFFTLVAIKAACSQNYLWFLSEAIGNIYRWL